ncbi:MAG: hypothetical protein ACLTBQ_08940 [Thomasclavelia sp.]|uniref:hypothetical protein n=1 Tax=Thomasclavelia sp. TaxID=3025757 RepID=UPI00399203E1
MQERLSSVSEEFEALSGSMKKKSARIKELQELIRRARIIAAKTVHTELNNIKFKKQRRMETSHDAELRLFYAACRILKENWTENLLPRSMETGICTVKNRVCRTVSAAQAAREEVIRLRQVQNAVDTALRRREQPQEVQRKKHEMDMILEVR